MERMNEGDLVFGIVLMNNIVHRQSISSVLSSSEMMTATMIVKTKG